MSAFEIVAGKHRASLAVSYSGEQRVSVAAAVLHPRYEDDPGHGGTFPSPPLSVCLFVCLSGSLSVCLSVYLSVCLFLSLGWFHLFHNNKNNNNSNNNNNKCISNVPDSSMMYV